MAKLKASQLNAGREHSTTATLVYDGDGGPESHEITVVFHGHSVGRNRQLVAAMGEDGKYQFVDYLAIYVKALPDIVGEDDQPVPITRELFNDWTVENVTALHNAIEAAVNPPKPSSEVTPAG